MRITKIVSEKTFLASLPILRRMVPKDQEYFVRLRVVCSLAEATYLLKQINQLAEVKNSA